MIEHVKLDKFYLAVESGYKIVFSKVISLIPSKFGLVIQTIVPFLLYGYWVRRNQSAESICKPTVAIL